MNDLFFTIMVLTHFILSVFLLFVLAMCCFGVKNTGLGVYYLAKGAVIKPLEYIICLVAALMRVNFFVWMSWFVLLLSAKIYLPEQHSKFAVFLLFGAYGWLLVMLIYRNISDDELRDGVRVTFARIERKMCFNNPKLTLYPEKWSNWA